MRKKSDAKVEANVRIYLIPKDEFETVDGKPKLDDKYLVYESKKKKKM
jgi:hypothetical protein